MPSFQVDLHPSKLFLRLTLIVYLLAVIAVWLTAFPFTASFVITLCLLVSLFWSIKKIKQTSSTLTYANSQWKLTQYSQNEIRNVDVKPADEMLIHRWLVIINFVESDFIFLEVNKNWRLFSWYHNKQRKKQHTLLVFPDSTNNESHRRLRVALQYAK